MSRPILELRNVTCERGGVRLINNVSFTLNNGENLILFGTEDSGISAMANLMIDIERDYTGDIFFRGNNLREFTYESAHDYKRQIGYVHGEYGLFSNMTVEGNISLPLEYHTSLSREEIKEQVNRLVFDLNLDHCKKMRPFDLTRSELLKTNYAMSIILDPDLLIVERAFESQCPLNVQTLLEHLKRRISLPDRSVIMITHNPQNFGDQGDRYMMMFSGKIVFDGSRDDFDASFNPYLKQYKENSTIGPMPIL